MKHHSRCRHCSARRALRKHPEEYLKPPKCRNCGARSWRIDLYRMAGKDKRPTCKSDCYHFFHRMGGGNCKFKPNGEYKDVE